VLGEIKEIVYEPRGSEDPQGVRRSQRKGSYVEYNENHR